MSKMSRYPIGFWNLCEFELTEIWKRPREIVKEWDEAGMSLAMSPMYTDFPGSREAMFEMLDEALKRDIRVMFYDMRLKQAWHPDQFDEEEVRAAILQLREDFGLHPAVEYIFVLDEPGCQRDQIEVENTIKVSKLVKELIPEKKPFVNFAPWSNGWGSKAIGRPGVKYQQALVDFVVQARLGAIGYDCYTQLLPDEWGKTEYYHNLKIFREVAKRTGIPFINTVLFTGHFRYREVTEDDFRWQLYTSVAHGADGVMGYFFYNRRMTGRYGLAPVDEHYERTCQYEKLSRVMRTFHKTFGPIMKKLKMEKVWHVKRAFANWPLFCEGDDENVFFVESDQEVILTRYRHEDGSLYYSLVNNSQMNACQCYVHFKADLTVYDVCGLQWEEETVPQNRYGEVYGVKTIRAGVWHEPHYYGNWLSPGSMCMWRITK
jgi:hypothetical protein